MQEHRSQLSMLKNSLNLVELLWGGRFTASTHPLPMAQSSSWAHWSIWRQSCVPKLGTVPGVQGDWYSHRRSTGGPHPKEELVIQKQPAPVHRNPLSPSNLASAKNEVGSHVSLNFFESQFHENLTAKLLKMFLNTLQITFKDILDFL